MHRFGAVAFSALLVCPLFAAPGFGYDGVRLPAVALVAAALLTAAALDAARSRERGGSSDPLGTAALIALGVQAASLAAAHTVWAGVAPLLLTGAGVAAYRFARGGLLPRGYVLETGAWVVAGVGLVAAVWGLAQRAVGLPAVGLEGNTNYSGTLAAVLLPPAAAFAFVRAAPWKRALSVAAAAGLAGLLLVSDSRAGLAGAAVGGLVAAFALVARRVPRAALAAGSIVAVLIAVPLVFQFGTHFSSGRLETIRARVEIWKGALRLAADRPWLGAGAGNFAVRYPLYRSETEFRFHQETAGVAFKEVEDAHSSWVQAAAEGGVPGFLALLLVVYVAVRLWRYYVKTAPDADTAAALAGFGGGAAAFLAAGLFNTLTVHASHTIFFWTFLGMIELLGNPRIGARRKPAGQAAVALPASGAVAATLGAWLALTVALAERDVNVAVATLPRPAREPLLRESIEQFPAGWRAHYELGKTLAATGRFAEASDAFREALRFRPNHLDGLHSLAGALLSGNLDLAEAEASLRRAVEMAPYDHRSHFNLGYLRLRQGRMLEARSHFEAAVQRNSRHGVSSYYIGVTYLASGEAARALEAFRRAREAGFDVAGALRQEHPALAGDPRYSEFFR